MVKKGPEKLYARQTDIADSRLNRPKGQLRVNALFFCPFFNQKSQDNIILESREGSLSVTYSAREDEQDSTSLF